MLAASGGRFVARVMACVVVLGTLLVAGLTVPRDQDKQLPDSFVQPDRLAFPSGLVGYSLVFFYLPRCFQCVQGMKDIAEVGLKVSADATGKFSGLSLYQFSCAGGYFCPPKGVLRVPTIRLYKDEEVVGELTGTSGGSSGILAWLEGQMPQPVASVQQP